MGLDALAVALFFGSMEIAQGKEGEGGSEGRWQAMQQQENGEVREADEEKE